MDQPHISGDAVIITGGLLDRINAKTAHGLVRGSRRFNIIGIIDDKFAGQDAGEVIDGENRNIPIEADIDTFLKKYTRPTYAIIGMATKGGVLPKELYPVISGMLHHGIHVVNGLHQPLSEIKEFKDVAYEHGDIIYDIRKSKPFDELHFWSGKVKDITATRIAVLGTDCATGKRTTARLLEDGMRSKGVNAHMIFTGQTGWMLGAGYGFLFDATANDFIPGELEHALYECWRNEQAEVLIMEGQSGLRNPSGPCGSEFIISGDAQGVVLQHPAKRTKFNGMESYPADLPEIMDEVKLIEKLGARVLGISINSTDMSEEEMRSYKADLAEKTSIPVVFPFHESVDEIIEAILELRK